MSHPDPASDPFSMIAHLERDHECAGDADLLDQLDAEDLRVLHGDLHRLDVMYREAHP